MSDERHYAVCVRNDGYQDSLEVRKIYEVLTDRVAESLGFLRIVDEDEDYLYHSSRFLRIQLSLKIETALARTIRR